MSPLLNKLVILLGVVALAFGGYYFVTTMSPAADDMAGTTSGADLAQSSEKIYTDLNKIRTITINDSLFIEKRFTSLVDTRVPLVEVKSGRPNPFAPIE